MMSFGSIFPPLDLISLYLAGLKPHLSNIVRVPSVHRPMMLSLPAEQTRDEKGMISELLTPVKYGFKEESLLSIG